MVICLEQGADLHMAQLMPLPLTVSCFSKIQIGLAFLVLAHPGSPGQRDIKRVCVCLEVWQITVFFNYWHIFCPSMSNSLLFPDFPSNLAFFLPNQCFDAVGWATGRTSSL